MGIEWPDNWAFSHRQSDFPYPFGVLARLDRAANQGALCAAVDGLLLCAEENRPPPVWAIATLGAAAVGHFPREAAGPFKRPYDAHRKNIIHRLRWQAVVAVDEVRLAWRLERKGDEADDVPSLAEQLRQAGLNANEARKRANIEIERFSLALIKGNRYELAQTVLENTPVFINWQAIKLSFELVERARIEDRMSVYYLPSANALEMVGWGDLAPVWRQIDCRIGGLFKRIHQPNNRSEESS